METNGGNYSARLDRIEGIIEAMATRQADIENDFTRLLTAQVVLTDRVDRIAQNLEQLGTRVEQLTIRVEQLTAAQLRNEEGFTAIGARIDNLVSAIGELTRRIPPPA
jgi:archaellum component FlaC